MGRHDWYRNREWTPEIEQAFNARVSRSRQSWSKWQYLTCQAGCLAHSGDPRLLEAALDLYARSLEQVNQVQDDWASESLHQMGELLLKMGRPQEAEQALRRSVEVCAPSRRHLFGSNCPEEDLARVLMHRGEEREARELQQAVEPLLSRPSWEELAGGEVLDASDQPYRDPDHAAEAIVVYHHAGDDLDADGTDALFAGTRDALCALDRLFLEAPPRHTYRRQFVVHYLFELGAYLGRVLVGAGGTWAAAAPLWRCRVLLADRRVDPFRAAYDVIYLDLPLVRVFDEVARGEGAGRPWVE